MTADLEPRKIDMSDIFEEFGDPSVKPLFQKVSSYATGVRCQLNPNCHKVNTAKCDLLECQGRTHFKAQHDGFSKPK